MPLVVVCPHCRARFQVSEKFAGKEGPCPKCKGKITIPKVEEQVQVHAPEEYAGAGKDVKGQPVLKPIERTKTQVQPVMLWGIAAVTVLVFLMAFVLRFVFPPPDGPPMWILTIGLILISPPLVIAAYSFLRDPELEPYEGQMLWVRCAICAAVYAALWGGFMFLPTEMQIWQWAYFAAPFLIAGSLTALATLDLDFGNAFFHYAFYVLVTILLRVAVGLSALKVTMQLVQRSPVEGLGRKANGRDLSPCGGLPAKQAFLLAVIFEHSTSRETASAWHSPR